MDTVTLTGEMVLKFAGQLEWAIDDLGVSREVVAEAWGVHVSQISQIKKFPDPSKVARLFKIIGRMEAKREFEALAKRD